MVWKSVELFLRDGLSREEVRASIHDHVLCAATEGGEFVRRIRIGRSVPHADGWRKWDAAYLPGPPGLFRH